MIIFYHDPKSYSCHKVQVYFSEKEIKWKSHPIDLLKKENILDENYKFIHPRGLVPALKDGEFILCNSTEIMEYISKKYLPTSDIFFDFTFSDAIHQFCKDDELLHDPHIRTLSYSKLWMANARSEEENNCLLELASKHPDKTRGQFLTKAVLGKFKPEEIKLAQDAIFNALADMEKKFSESPSNFIFGNKYSMADAICTARLFRFGRLNIKIELLKDRYPRTAAFYEMAKQRPSFQELQT